jgi:hypothetical protein
VRRRSMVGAILGALTITLGTMLVLVAGSLVVFGIELVIDMWDSDAGGRVGPGAPFAALAAVAALVGLLLDLTSRRPTVTSR